jgi:hypothetical protein
MSQNKHEPSSLPSISSARELPQSSTFWTQNRPSLGSSRSSTCTGTTNGLAMVANCNQTATAGARSGAAPKPPLPPTLATCFVCAPASRPGRGGGGAELLRPPGLSFYCPFWGGAPSASGTSGVYCTQSCLVLPITSLGAFGLEAERCRQWCHLATCQMPSSCSCL